MKAIRHGRFYCGTSNITLPGNKSTFPPAYQSRTRLAYYSSQFNSLEVNSSFYKIPMQKTFSKWAEDVGKDFLFTVKLWRGISHNKQFAYDLTDLAAFLQAASGVGKHQGCLLIQLPGSIKAEHQAGLKQLLSHIRSFDSSGWRLAVEFRDSGWYSDATIKLLDEFDASVVQHDMPGSIPTILNSGADFVMLRFHGEQGDYRGSYRQELLQAKARDVVTWLQSGNDVFAYFNNTIGEAYANAISFRTLVLSGIE